MGRGCGDSGPESGSPLRKSYARYLRPAVVLVVASLLVTSAVAPFVSVAAATDAGQNENTLSYQAQPDLEVVDVSWRPSDPSAGETTDFQLTVKNTGDAMAEDVELKVYVDGEFVAMPVAVDLGPGEQTTSTWAGNHEITGGDHTIVGKVDPDGHISESDESNNDRTESLSVEVKNGRIAGQVTDESGNPISSAMVYLDDTTSTRTNSNGYYEFTGVPTGKHDVDVRITGYHGESATVTVYEDQTTTQDFSLTAETPTVSLSSAPIDVTTSGGGTYEYGSSVTIEAPSQSGEYEFDAWVTSDGTVFAESPTYTIDYLTTDRTLIAQYKKPGKPDLVLDDVDWSPTNPEEGESVDLQVDVSNTGDSRATNVGVEVSVGNNIYRYNDLTLSAGGSKTISFGPWAADQSADDVTATVDYSDDVAETDETNNADTDTIDVTDQQPDLQVTDVQLQPTNPAAGETVSVTVDVSNTGDASAANVDTKLTVQQTTLSHSNVDLSAGETTSLNLGTFTADATDGTGITATGVVDYTSEVTEQNEANNERSETFSVDNPQPDLRVVDLEVRPNNLTVGESAEFRLTIENTGDAAATSVTSEIRIGGSTAAVPPVVDVPAGSTVTTVWTGSYEFTAGSHQITGVVDPSDGVTESDDGNNARTETVSVDSNTGTVLGRVVGPNGDPIEAAKVYLDSRTDTRTNSSGYYEFTGVPAGQHTVEVVMSGYTAPSATVDVPNGGTTSQDFTLTRETFTVTLNSAPIQVTTNGGGTYEYGTNLTVSAPATKDGYTFDSWTENGEVVSTSPEFTIDHLNQNYDLTAQYTTTGTPDVAVVDVEPTRVTAGSTADFQVTLANRGDARAASFGVELRVGNNIFRQTGIALEPGETQVVTVGAWTVEPDASTVSVTADYEDHVKESDESNNAHEESLSVTTPTVTSTTTSNSGGDSGGGDGPPTTTEPSPTTTTPTTTTTTTSTTTPTSNTTTSTVSNTTTSTVTVTTRVGTTPTVTTTHTSSVEAPTTATSTSEPPEKPASLTVNIETADGTPAAGTVEVLGVTGQRDADDGTVRFGDLTAGTYAVKVTSELFPGGSTTKTVELESGSNTVTVTGPDRVTAYGKVAIANTEIKAPLSDLKVTVAGREAEVGPDGRFKIDGTLSTGPHTVRVLYNGKVLARQKHYLHTGGNEITVSVEATQGFIEDFANTLSVYNRGMVFGEWGVTHQDTVEQSNSIPYFLGWMGGSILPVADVFADARDCLVMNGGGAWQIMDCGGALVSAAGSVGTVVGVLGAPVTAGSSLALAGAGASLDTYEDVLDVATIVKKFIRLTDVAQIKIAKALEGSLPIDLLRKVLDKLPSELRSTLDELIQSRRVSTFKKLDGITDEQAEVLAKSDVQVSQVQKLLKADGLDAEIVTKLADNDLLKHGLAPETLRRLSKRSDDLATISKHVDELLSTGFKPDQIDDLVKHGGSLKYAKKLVEAGADPAGAVRLAENSVKIRKVVNMLATKYSGTWSKGEPGDNYHNFLLHWDAHADEWPNKLTKSEYRKRATSLMNKREDVIIVYQKGRENILIADESSGAIVIGGVNGKNVIQTFMRPTVGAKSYAMKQVRNGRILLKSDG